MGRPPSGLDEYLDWQERLESFKASGLEIDVFCLNGRSSMPLHPKLIGLLSRPVVATAVPMSGGRISD